MPDSREPDVLVDDFISNEKRPHSISLGREVRIRVRSVCNSKSRPGREGHRNLVVGEVSSSDLATEEDKWKGRDESARVFGTALKLERHEGVSRKRWEGGGKEVELTEVSCSPQRSTNSQWTRRRELQASTRACNVRTRGER